ncbi:speckle-type POZ protein homolog [Paramacrobiotus metropolitanus]|nr:speckle-type POZ protein homolog [Paramacrobiotus metropolitanus]
MEIGASYLLDDLRKLYTSQEGCDMVLVSSDNGLFPVHKAILIARSKVFAAMLIHPTTEAENGICRIDDTDGETIAAMLEFMYTATCADLSIMAEKLVVAADKYDLADLRAVCQECLCSSLNVASAARMLILSNQHDLKRLREASLQLSIHNMSQFAEAGGLDELRQYNTEFFLDVLAQYGLLAGTKENVDSESKIPGDLRIHDASQ